MLHSVLIFAPAPDVPLSPVTAISVLSARIASSRRPPYVAKHSEVDHVRAFTSEGLDAGYHV